MIYPIKMQYQYQVSEIKIDYRFLEMPAFRITSASECFETLKPYFEPHQDHHECFRVLLYSRAHDLVSIYDLSQGGVSGTVVDIRMLFQAAILSNASAIVLAHNHPSGNKNASTPDKQLTEKIKQVAQLHDIKLLDHLILARDSFGNMDYMSFANEGMM
jgi:DNA repair protein RadC